MVVNVFGFCVEGIKWEKAIKALFTFMLDYLKESYTK